MKQYLPGVCMMFVFLIPVIAAAQTPPATSAEPEASSPTIEDRVSRAESWLSRLERLGISGYVQARGQYQDDVTPTTNFFVRRARLNFRHTGNRSRLAISLDGGLGTVAVQDAYLDLIAVQGTGQRQGLVLRAGQFFRPFGFEIERQEAEREFPERPFGWLAFFPGNRDVGADLSWGLTSTTTVNVAVVNGGGTAALSFRDPDDHKDVMVRLRQSFFGPRLDLAFSYYLGEQTVPGTAAVPAQTGFVDENGNGVQDPSEPTVVITPARAAKSSVTGDRDRWGVALNAYDLFGGTFRGEYVGAQDLTTNLAGGPTQKTATAYAYYVQYLRYVTFGFSAGARYDAYDPDTSDEARLGGDGEQHTIGFIVLRPIGDNIRASLAWERPTLTTYDTTTHNTRDVDLPMWTLQMLCRF
jgi:hypothetical protein